MFKNKQTGRYEIERQPFAHYVKKEICGMRIKLPVFKSMIIRRFKANPHGAFDFYERKGLDSESLFSIAFAAFQYDEKTEEAKRELEKIKQEREKEIASLIERKNQIEKRIERMREINSSAKDEGMFYNIHLLESLTKRLSDTIKEKREVLEKELKQKAKELHEAAIKKSVQKLKDLLEHDGLKNKPGV